MCKFNVYFNGKDAKLTPDQRIVFTVVKKTHFDLACKNPLRLFISGGAGTRKSFLIKTLVEWLKFFTAPFAGSNPVLVCGPTGTSAKNIHGKTLHSTFKLPVQHGSEPTYKELSSLSAIKGKDDYFGGINVILIGDFHQLKPVRGTFAFPNFLLWSLFDTYILKTIMRQTSSDGYSELLNRIRVGTFTLKDIKSLSTRLIERNDPRFDGVLRVYPFFQSIPVPPYPLLALGI